VQKPWETIGNSLAAEARLAQMEAMEDDLKWYDDETDESLKQPVASSYRTLIGVSPEQRTAFRGALEALRETGDRSVEELIRQFRDQSGKTLSLAAGPVGA
jgi:hypothetical protein